MSQKLCELCFVKLSKEETHGVCAQCIFTMAKHFVEGSHDFVKNPLYNCKECSKPIQNENRYWCTNCKNSNRLAKKRRWVD